MELRTSCESDVEFGKQQGQGHILLCVACDYCRVFVRRRNLRMAWAHACFLVSSGLAVVYTSGLSVVWIFEDLNRIASIRQESPIGPTLETTV